jgi:wyosine [tRNA(Phe)-imidazoG37] synthetase (radical SAM superfamily)
VNDPKNPERRPFLSHSRNFAQNVYVYPVVSRRARGVSIGVNLNPGKTCNFDCIYCQIDRTGQCQEGQVDLGRLRDELDRTVELVVTGRLFDSPSFAYVPEPLRRLNDIALSGDGEPTVCGNFDEVVSVAADIRRRHALDEAKLVLITNASLLHLDRVRRGLAVLDENNGEIWAKLDAGTEEYYRQVNRAHIRFQHILENLRKGAKVRPIVIQSLWTRIHGVPPSAAEIDAYAGRLNDIVASGGRIKLVQIYSVARLPAENWVSALSDEEVNATVGQVRGKTGLPVEGFCT